MPGTSLAALDETDIETLFDFVAYLVHKESGEGGSGDKSVMINGKRYKLVDQFTERI